MKRVGLLTLACCLSTPSVAAGNAVEEDRQTIMIIIAAAKEGSAAISPAMSRLSFPTIEACERAAKILQQDTPGAQITARCLSAR
jgi:hypothetical protein